MMKQGSDRSIYMHNKIYIWHGYLYSIIAPLFVCFIHPSHLLSALLSLRLLELRRLAPKSTNLQNWSVELKLGQRDQSPKIASKKRWGGPQQQSGP